MKRLKHVWMTILTVILAVTMIVGGTSLSAFAAPAVTDTNGTSIISSVVLPSSVELGKEVVVPSSSKVTAPNGVEFVASKFTADTLGNYIVEYISNGYTYTKNVNCYLTETFDFRVAHDGADIPTYVNSNTTNNDFKFPSAALYYLDDETSEYVEYDKTKYDYKVYVDNTEVAKDASYPSFSPGVRTVQYIATLNGTTKSFVKEYTVKSQSGFTDGEGNATRPTLSISGIPSEASVNTKVTLPKASTTDNFDTNVKVAISVFNKNGPVKMVEVDDYGYAKTTLEKEVEFDNVHNMVFYPTEIGTYTIEYQAIDDAGKTSVKQSQVLSVLDKTAPKLEEIADDQIPSRWGREIKAKDDNDFVTNKTITFPFPVYSDNSSDDISVSFEIRDTANNNTVIKFANIYDFTENEDGTYELGSGAQYKYNSATPSNGLYIESGDENKVFNFSPKDGFKFTLNNYTPADDLATTGTYTAIYQARDKKPNITSKSYDITVEAKLEDTVAPDVTLSADDYLYVEGTEFQEYTLPLATVTDNTDSRPTIEYKITAGTASFTVENGATIEINDKQIKYEDEALQNYTGNVLEISVVGVDNVGNKSNETTASISLAKAESFVGTNNVELKISNLTKTGSNNEVNSEVVFGSLEINEFEAEFKAFNGFEIALTNEAGDVINGLSLETYVNKVGATTKSRIHVDKIAFTPSVAGEYTLTVRAFDISGRSLVKAFTATVVNSNTGGDTIEKASAVQSTGDVHVAYKLRNQTATGIQVDPDRRYISTRIANAGKFSLMGIEFTAMSAGKYSFTDGYYAPPTTQEPDNFRPLSATYHLNASDTSNAVFEVLGRMPTKASITTIPNIDLPEVIAFTEYNNATIDISITSPSSKSLTMGTEIIKHPATSTSGVKYSFVGSEHGVYTVTYTATINGSPDVKQTFSIRVGDVEPPIFELVGSHVSSAFVDSKFEFLKINTEKFVNINQSESNPNPDKIEDVTFTKNLYDPSGTIVYTVSGKGKTYAEMLIKSSDDEGYTFTKSGFYTVEYTATDKHKNTSIIKETINVTASGTVSTIPLKVVRTILIIVGILLIAGVIFYLVRYRKERRLVK